MAGDLKDLLGPALHGPRCGVARVLTRLPDDDRKLVLTALEHPDGNSRRIAAYLAETVEEGAPTKDTVARHRRGDCACPRPDRD